MPDLSAVHAAALRLVSVIAFGAIFLGAMPASADWNKPWKDSERALVIDAYEFNPINWKQMTSDKRIAGFISKASDGLPPEWSCGKLSGDLLNLCKNRWWKYSVTQELYMTRREMAKTLGLKWGAYHLGRPGNPREQADHFVDFAQPEPDDLIALDIEDNTSEWMSLADAEIFAQQIKIRLGRYPVLYTNGNTVDYIARNKAQYPLLSRLQLWYARYRDDISGVFPAGNWDKYALWQFSSMHNCGSRSCPYRVAGAKNDIDVNVSPLTVAELREAWPFNGLVGPDPAPSEDPGALIASVSDDAKKAVADDVETELAAKTDNAAVPGTLAAAFGPSGHATIDPLALLTETARQEHAGKLASPVLSALTDSRQVNPPIPGDRPVEAKLAAPQPGTIADAVTQLREEMQAVREILSDTAEPENAPDRRSELPQHLKSHLADLLEKANVTVNRVPLIGPQWPGRPHKRAELQNGRGDWTLLAALNVADRRVVKAFDTTR